MQHSYFPMELVVPNEASFGQVITFYSYKGGTGRTMALVNVAVLLGESGSSSNNVLAVDWDLEAPGLHRYFASRCEGFSDEHKLTPASIDMIPGLIDLWYELKQLTADFPAYREEPDADVISKSMES